MPLSYSSDTYTVPFDKYLKYLIFVCVHASICQYILLYWNSKISKKHNWKIRILQNLKATNANRYMLPFWFTKGTTKNKNNLAQNLISGEHSKNCSFSSPCNLFSTYPCLSSLTTRNYAVNSINQVTSYPRLLLSAQKVSHYLYFCKIILSSH